MSRFTESTVEEVALEWLADQGYTVAHGLDLLPGGSSPERADYAQVVLEGRLREALARLNPNLPPTAQEDALRKLTRPEGPTLVARNHALHRMLADGVTVEYKRPDGSIAGDRTRVLDYENPRTGNDWLAVNQFTVVERGAHAARPNTIAAPTSSCSPTGCRWR
jgi:type I restriction enzyme R subunit